MLGLLINLLFLSYLVHLMLPNAVWCFDVAAAVVQLVGMGLVHFFALRSGFRF